jgi:hypothetical protein
VKERAEGFAGGNARKEEGRRKVTVVGCTDLKAGRYSFSSASCLSSVGSPRHTTSTHDCFGDTLAIC